MCIYICIIKLSYAIYSISHVHVALDLSSRPQIRGPLQLRRAVGELAEAPAAAAALEEDTKLRPHSSFSATVVSNTP